MVLSNLESSSSSLYVVTCWTLWKAKNASVFYDKNLDIWRLINQVQTIYNDMMVAFQHAC